MIDVLKQADYYVFYIINHKLASPSFDGIMLLLRQAYTWIPLYLFMLLFFLFNCRRFILPIVACSLLTFAVADFTSSQLKKAIGRVRPCYNTEITFVVNNLPGCGGKYSMPSSHASNHFGLSAFWFLIISHTLQRKWYWLWFWAAAVGFAQIYVGVHFPFDILLGALFGSAVGFLTYYLFIKWTDHQQNNEAAKVAI